MEDSLSIDVSEALAAAARVDAAFAQIGVTLQTAIDTALQSVTAVEVPVEVTADTEQVTPAIDAALEAANTVLPVEADTDTITSSIDAAVDASDAVVPLEVDTSGIEEAISAIDPEPIEIPVETADVDAATQALGGLDEAAEKSGESATAVSAQYANIGSFAKVAAGDTSGLTAALANVGPAGAAAAGALTAVTVATGAFFAAGLDSVAATERFNLILGDMADEVANINIGGLNEDLTTLAIRLGDDDEALQNAAATMFSLGRNSGIAAPEVATVTENIIALAARAVALNPALGEVGSVTERLFTAIARGGRFAANFGLSLSSAEINARAFSNTGKTLASDLTLFDKSTAGAQLAVERLGDSLAVDLNAGADNVQFRLRALRGQFNETLDALGEPLVEPLLQSLQTATPALQDLAGVFGTLAQATVPLVVALAESLGPAMQIVSVPAAIVADALEVVATVVGIVPAPVLAAAGAFVVLNTALNALAVGGAASALATRLPILTGSLLRLSTLAGPAALGIAGIAGAIALVNAQVAAGEENVDAFLGSIVATVNQAGDIETLEAKIAAARDAAAGFREDADNQRGGFLGSFGSTGEIRDLENAATGLESIDVAGQGLINTARSLQQEFNLTSSAALTLARGGTAAIDAFRAQTGAVVDLSDAQLAGARANEEFWAAVRSGAVDAEDIANRAAELGVSFEDLSTQVAGAREPVVEFATAITESLPGAAAALDALGENEGLDKFLLNLETNVANAAAFIGNLDTLISTGAADLARVLAELSSVDPTQAAALAAEAVDRGVQGVLDVEKRIDAANFGNALVGAATQNVSDKLGGGLELAALEAQRRFGEQLEGIPGNLADTASSVGEGISTEVSDSILKSTALVQFPSDMEDIGREGAAGFYNGLGQFVPTGAQDPGALATRTLDRVRDVLGIQSPSRVMIEVGKLVAEGFFVGLADTSGAAAAVDPILDVVKEFGLTAQQVASAAGANVDELTASLTRLGEEQDKLTPEKLLAVGEAVKALGGSAGVKDLAANLAQQVSKAFGGMSAADIGSVVSTLTTKAALDRVTTFSGVTPRVPTPFETQVVKGEDRFATTIEQNITVTPPPEATMAEVAGELAVASSWALQGVTV